MQISRPGFCASCPIASAQAAPSGNASSIGPETRRQRPTTSLLGLHALLLLGKARELAPIYRKGAIADADMQTLLQAVLQRHDAELTAFIENPPQTNEARRAAGIIAAAHWLKAYNGCDLIASELGAIAGLNLLFDKFHLALGDGYGPQNSSV